MYFGPSYILLQLRTFSIISAYSNQLYNRHWMNDSGSSGMSIPWTLCRSCSFQASLTVTMSAFMMPKLSSSDTLCW